MHTFAEINTPEREGDNSRVLLLHENVFGEPLVVEDDISWETLTFVSPQLARRLLRGCVAISDRGSVFNMRSLPV